MLRHPTEWKLSVDPQRLGSGGQNPDYVCSATCGAQTKTETTAMNSAHDRAVLVGPLSLPSPKAWT